MSVVSATPLLGYDNNKQILLNKKLNSYPKIEHPSKRINHDDKNNLDIRGRSRDGHGDGHLIRNEYSLLETNNHPRRSSSLQYNSNKKKYSLYNDNNQTINELNQDQVRLPIFGKFYFYINFY